MLYLISLTHETSLSETDNTPMSLTERLIHSGKMPPIIIIVPGQLIGYGSDAALTKDLVPYVDGKFRAIPNRRHRGVGGISNGAAIAARMAFQFPETFGSVGLLSGGLADGEGDHFEGWLLRTPPQLWPRVRIDVGDRDAIMRLTQNLLTLLDKHHVPYIAIQKSFFHSPNNYYSACHTCPHRRCGLRGAVPFDKVSTGFRQAQPPAQPNGSGHRPRRRSTCTRSVAEW